MNYEQKYKDALSRATFYNNELPTEKQRKMLLDIFPELKESEDERIRKAIKKALQVRCDGSRIISDEPVTLEEAIAWLEKQGEKRPTDKAEPKFKVGDWITNGYDTWKIVGVKPLDYILQSQDGNIVDDTISYVDEKFHSFTIEDAKKELKKIEPKKLDADKVIAWLVANICDFEYYVKLFKKDFEI